MQKHRLDIFQRQRGLTAHLFRPRCVGKEGKKRTVLTGGSDEIVFAGELSQPLLETFVGSLLIRSEQPGQNRARNKLVKIPGQELGG